MISDGGTQFTSGEFNKFASDWNFQHVRSSPRYPQSNGMAERTIQTVKRILKKSNETRQDPYLALLEFRNTPLSGLGSPAQLLMNRQLRGSLPMSTHKSNTNPI